MVDIFYFVIFLGSIAFAIMIIYICLLLKRVSDSMKTVGNTLDKVEKQLQHVTPELKQTLSETVNLVDDVDSKLKATDSVFDTAQNIGTSVHSINDMYAMKRNNMSDEEIYNQAKPFFEGIKWSEAATQLYSKWKRKKTSKET